MRERVFSINKTGTSVLFGNKCLRSDKHLISKMEKPKVANPKLELFGDSLLQFFVCACFQTVCLDLSEQFISHFISFLILHLKRWALGFLQIWSNGPLLPSLSTLFLPPFCRSGFFLSPLSSGFYLSTSVLRFFTSPFCRMGNLLPSPKPG